jgi:hypothetical protein
MSYQEEVESKGAREKFPSGAKAQLLLVAGFWRI